MNIKFYLFFLFVSVGLFSLAQTPLRNATSKHFLIANIGFGPSVLVEKAPTELGTAFENYYNDVRVGWNSNAEIGFFFNPYIGAGISYDHFSSKVDADSIIVELFTTKFAFDLSNRINIHSISPLAIGRYEIPDIKLSVTAHAGPAWLFYRNLGKNVGDSAMFKGSSPGLKLGVKVNYLFTNSFGINLDAQFLNAYLRQITKVTDTETETLKLESDNYQNISRYNFLIGVNYKFKLRR